MQAFVTKDELLRVPFSRMRLDPENERLDQGNMGWLVSNIRNEGVKEAMWGYKGLDDARRECYFVVNGSRRFAALRAIYDDGKGIDIVAPFKTFNPDKVNAEQRIVERLIRNEGLPYSRLEKAASIGKLSAYGWSNHKIAQQLSMSVTWVADTLLLHAAPQKLKNIIAAKGVSASLAIEMIKKGEIDVFLAEHANDPAPAAEPLTDLSAQQTTEPPEPKSTGLKKNKITKKDIQINSVTEFKDFARRADPGKMSAGSSRYFAFICRLINNELRQQDYAEFFR